MVSNEYYHELAKERHVKLWAMYEKKGELTVSDILRVCKVSNHASVIRSFSRYGLKIPPVANAHYEKAKKQCTKLWLIAGNRSSISSNEACKVLECRKASMGTMISKFRRWNLEIPKIDYGRQKHSDTTDMEREHIPEFGVLIGIDETLRDYSWPDGREGWIIQLR